MKPETLARKAVAPIPHHPFGQPLQHPGEPPEPQVGFQLTRLQDELEDLRQRTLLLQERLQPVLRPMHVLAGELAVGQAPPIQSPLADTLAEKTANLAGTTSLIQDLLDRLEV